jgi:4-carboxymuconolactone decarboxylase
MMAKATIGSALALSLAAGSPMGPDRLPPLTEAQQTPAQKAASAEFLKTRKTPVFGPFTPLLRSPDLMLAAKDMGDYLRYKSTLGQHISEFSILVVARQWNQPVEWEIHQPIALKNGVSQATADAISAGRRPRTMTADEAVAYDFLTELDKTRQVSDATYARAVKTFGEPGVIDLTGIAGYYTLLAMTMNVARTPTSTDNPPKLSSLKP